MQDALLDLTALVRKLAGRTSARTEATVQSWLHALLLAAPLNLEEGHLNDIVLEQPAGHRRRIDVEVGLCVFEVKRDLRTGRVREEAEVQLAGYVAQQTDRMGQRYVGVLTDGCEWHLYRLQAGSLVLVSSLTISPDHPDVEALCVWLEGVLATGEQIEPTPREIERLLGARSPGHLLDIAELVGLYQDNKDHPGVRVRRRLWAKLLTTALGTAFRDDDLFFVQHTLLVVSAEVVAHAVLGLEPAEVPARALVSGQQFRAAGVLGVVESDFFDWAAEAPGGESFIRGLARRLSRFAWAQVEHDVLKVLYESVIPAEQRKQLGEYYTPDWLARHMVEETLTDPLAMRVLDPSCGSGTFVFYAVRRYLEAAEAAGRPNREALASVCSQVMGIDLHPVAVTLARVTYLLAVGAQRLADDRGPISIPIFLGDSLQWDETTQTRGAMVVLTEDSPQLFPAELRFPDSLVADAGRFDALVAELAELAANRKPGSPPPALGPVCSRYSVAPADRRTIDDTFRLMCSLHDQGRDHIWGYYVRNLVRPRWLARADSRVDVLIGNPPWLSYRFMTPSMQDDFRRLAEERGLWPGAKSVTHLDLSALFVVRAIERYLQVGGRFAFVMPYAALSRQHFAGFRAGAWARKGSAVFVAFEEARDLHAIKPPFFEVPCCIVRGRRAAHGRQALPMPQVVQAWSGSLPSSKLASGAAQLCVSMAASLVKPATTASPASYFGQRFMQGATLVPRMLCLVEEVPAGPLGKVSHVVRVRSRRTVSEKQPWKDLPSLEASVERGFVLPVHLGETILPYRPLEPFRAVIPWDGKRLLHSGDERLAGYPGLHAWWTAAEEVWNANRSSERLTLIERFNYHRTLAKQFIYPGICFDRRVVYSASGMYLAAAVVTNPLAVIEHKLYWATAASPDEARFLCAVLNSEQVTLAVRSYQARGEHNPRDFDMYVWQLPIPDFDANNRLHMRLAKLAAKAEALVAGLELPETRFEKQRRFIRERLAASSIGKQIEAAVQQLLEDGA